MVRKLERKLIFCCSCGSEAKPCHRYRVNDLWICRSCQDKKRMLTYGKMRITYKGIRIQLDHIPRSGVCSLCGQRGNTDLHHKEYEDSDPLLHTVELCDTCHFKESWKLGVFSNKDYSNRDPNTGRFTPRQVLG